MSVVVSYRKESLCPMCSEYNDMSLIWAKTREWRKVVVCVQIHDDDDDACDKKNNVYSYLCCRD